jgi:putrescine transport system permease protein
MIPSMRRTDTSGGKRLIIGLPALWLGLFFAVPFLIILRMSLSDPASAQPPYRPLLDLGLGFEGLATFLRGLDVENFLTVLTDPLYRDGFMTSLRVAFVATLLTLMIGYPMALAITRAPSPWRPLLLALVILPFWTSFLIRVYAWIGILKQEGLLNQFLIWTGVISAPLAILDTEIAVLIGIAYTYLPFMILPIYAALDKQDQALVEAALDLGAKPLAAFWRITAPLSWQGVFGGSLLVFIPAMGEFVIPDLLGGSDTLMIGRLVWTEFFNNRDWPMASAMAALLLAIIAIPIVLGQRRQAMAGSP